jgi:hypothetical protein
MQIRFSRLRSDDAVYYVEAMVRQSRKIVGVGSSVSVAEAAIKHSVSNTKLKRREHISSGTTLQTDKRNS